MFSKLQEYANKGFINQKNNRKFLKIQNDNLKLKENNLEKSSH